MCDRHPEMPAHPVGEALLAGVVEAVAAEVLLARARASRLRGERELVLEQRAPAVTRLSATGAAAVQKSFPNRPADPLAPGIAGRSSLRSAAPRRCRGKSEAPPNDGASSPQGGYQMVPQLIARVDGLPVSLLDRERVWPAANSPAR